MQYTYDRARARMIHVQYSELAEETRVFLYESRRTDGGETF